MLTPNGLYIIRKKVTRNFRRSIRKMTEDLQTSRGTIRRIVKEDLGMKPFKILRRHLTSQGSKAKRLERTKKMLQAMRSAGDKVFIWSDETIFTVEPQVNAQNGKVLATSSASVDPSIRTAYCRQKPAGVMVWAAVASDGQKSPLVSFRKA